MPKLSDLKPKTEEIKKETAPNAIISKPTTPRRKIETKAKSNESIEILKRFIEEEFRKVGSRIDYLEVNNKNEALRQLEVLENHFKKLNKSKKVMDSFSKLRELLIE